MLTIEKKIVINATQNTIYQALTDSEKIIQFFPLKQVVSDWLVGEPVLYKGEINAQPFTDFGVIELLEVNKKYQYRYWSDNHGTSNIPENYLTICYELKKINESTELSVLQTNLPSKQMQQVMDELVWPQLLSSLKAYVELEE